MTKIPSVEDYSIDITSDLAGVLSSDLYDELENRTIKGLTDQRTALLTELRDGGMLEEKDTSGFEHDPLHPLLTNYLGHNTLARAIKVRINNLIKHTNV